MPECADLYFGFRGGKVDFKPKSHALYPGIISVVPSTAVLNNKIKFCLPLYQFSLLNSIFRARIGDP